MLCFIHISDMHFKESESWESNRVLSGLIRDLVEKKKSEHLNPDYVLVTGDIAFSGKGGEYRLAQSFFEKLGDSLGMSRDKMLFVPGNHDIDRDRISDTGRLVIDGLRKGEGDYSLSTLYDNDMESSGRNCLVEPFHAYNSFVTDECKFPAERLWWTKLLQVEKSVVVLLGMNSAWSAIDDSHQTIAIDEYQVEKALQESDAESAELVISLVHHPIDLIAEEHDLGAADLLKYHTDLVLCGHRHKASQTSYKQGTTQLAAGASFENRRKNNSYNILLLDPSNRCGKVLSRHWISDKGGMWTWNPAVGPNKDNKPGRDEIVLNRQRSELPPNQKRTQSISATDTIRKTKKEPTPTLSRKEGARNAPRAGGRQVSALKPMLRHDFKDEDVVNGFAKSPGDCETVYGTVPNFYRDYQVELLVNLPCFEDRDRIDILDLGCGPGIIGMKVAERYREANVFFLDYSPAMLRACQKNIDSLKKEEGRAGFDPDRRKLETLELNLESDEWARNLDSKSFEYIFSAQTVHHLPEPVKRVLFKSAIRLLDPNGILLISDRIAFRPEAFELYRNLWNIEYAKRNMSDLPAEYKYRHYRKEEDDRGDTPSSLEDQMNWLLMQGLKAECFWRHGNRAIFGGQNRTA